MFLKILSIPNPNLPIICSSKKNPEIQGVQETAPTKKERKEILMNIPRKATRLKSDSPTTTESSNVV